MDRDLTFKLPRIVTKKELRLIVPYTSQHILRLEKQGKFPKRLQIGSRRVGWYLSEIEAWLYARRRGACSAFIAGARDPALPRDRRSIRT
jgi:prophage regulatory protein